MSKNHVLNVDFHAKCKDVPIFSPAQESLSQVLYLNWLYHCYVISLRTNTQADSTVDPPKPNLTQKFIRRG